MPVRNLTKAVRVASCDVTASQWQLFSDPKRDEAARDLNLAFEQAVNRGEKRWGVEKAVGVAMKEWADLGAMDSEAFHMLEDMLDEIFGRD